MAGHSKWANIKHKKAAADAKRNKVFTKLAKEITVAARLGGADETSNSRLRTAVIKARQGNMPKDNIDRAIKRGVGDSDGVSLEEIIYEGYGSGGIAIMIEVVTDKKSRTLPEIKNIFSKAGGSFAEAGAVSYLFEHKGLILIQGESIDEELLFEAAIEAGAEDIEPDDDNVFAIKTEKENFHATLSKLEAVAEKNSWEIIESSLQYLPSATVTLDVEKGTAVLKLLDTLENHDDVQNVFSNLELTDELMSVEI